MRARVEIEIGHAQGAQLAAPDAVAVGDGEQRADALAVAGRQRLDQRGHERGRRDAVAPSTVGRRHVEPGARVGADLAVAGGAAEDDAQRVQRVADRRAGQAGGDEVVDEPLEVGAGDGRQLGRPEARQDAQAQGALVGTDRARLVGHVRAVEDRPVAHADDQLVGRLAQADLGRRPQLALADGDHRRGPPRLRLGHRREVLAQRPVAREPPGNVRLPARLAVALGLVIDPHRRADHGRAAARVLRVDARRRPTRHGRPPSAGRWPGAGRRSRSGRASRRGSASRATP